jgi:glycosyltransferase involved in cell wall biosynthesis
MKIISIVTPCYNEEDNVEDLYHRIKAVFNGLTSYSYEHIFIDNCSTDNTQQILKKIASLDSNVKIIINSRNFGHIRSPYYGLLQAEGNAVIIMSSDLQDPPEKIPEFIEKWKEGFEIVIGVKTSSDEAILMKLIRKQYYKTIGKLSNIQMFEQFTGFGLYDQRIIRILKKMNDPYPYFRGMIAEIGFNVAKIPFKQPRRERGITKNNFYSLFDLAMLGVTNHSKIPLRMATFIGFILSGLSLLVAVVYLAAKLIFWEYFTAGIAPILIGVFFFSSVQLFFIGIIGEYLGAIHTQVLNRPLVIEKERINFGKIDD